MSSIFTDFLLELERGSCSPEPATFDQLWKALRSVLTTEMKRRGVWSSPPSFLGVFGWTRWSEPTAPTDLEPNGDALEELLAECYSYVFVHRLRALQAQLEVRPNVDGLVFLNVRHFLHDTQKRFDPLGFRVYEVVQTAVRQLIASGELHVIEGDLRVRNETILSFRRGCDPTEAEGTQLGERVSAWNEELLPALVTARGKELEQVLDQLAGKLRELSSHGAHAFRFKDLIDAFKIDVRARWAAIFERSLGEPAPGLAEDGGGELREVVRIVQPDGSFEERDRLEKLIGCVETRIELSRLETASNRHLTRLWRFLCANAVEWSENHQDGEERLDDYDRLSRRKLAELLRIPRDRLPGLFRQLGHLLEGCRELHTPSREKRWEKR